MAQDNAGQDGLDALEAAYAQSASHLQRLDGMLAGWQLMLSTLAAIAADEDDEPVSAALAAAALLRLGLLAEERM